MLVVTGRTDLTEWRTQEKGGFGEKENGKEEEDVSG